MAIGQFYKLTVSPKDATKMIGGLQDNGGQILNQGNWNNYHGGDGMDNVIDPNNDNIVYGFTQNGGSLNISSDSGQSIGFVGPPPGRAMVTRSAETGSLPWPLGQTEQYTAVLTGCINLWGTVGKRVRPIILEALRMAGSFGRSHCRPHQSGSTICRRGCLYFSQ